MRRIKSWLDHIGLVPHPEVHVSRGMFKVADTCFEDDEYGEDRKQELSHAWGRIVPDGIMFLDANQSSRAGLTHDQHVVFIEVEKTSPMTPSKMNRYVDIWMAIGDTCWGFSLLVIDNYGFRWVDPKYLMWGFVPKRRPIET